MGKVSNLYGTSLFSLPATGTPEPVCLVTYDANGGGGALPEDSTRYSVGDTVTVLPRGSIAEGGVTKNNNNFIKWSTTAIDSGTDYDGGDTFVITDDVILYAKWLEVTATTNENYNDINGGTEKQLKKSFVTSDSNVIIPESIGGYPVTSIEGTTTVGGGVFSSDTITSVRLPDTITEIGQNAFFGNTKLEDVNLPEGLTTISDNLFNGCTSLVEIDIPNGVETIGESAFYRSGIKNIEIPDTVTSIGNNAFSRSKIETITIPESITTLADSLFNSCVNLTSVTLGSSLEIINLSCFFGCVLLETINIPDSVRTIEKEAFSGCTGLDTIDLSNVQIIGQQAFYGCTELDEIIIPDSVNSLGKLAFRECSTATSLSIGSGLTIIPEQAFYNCNALKQILIPDTVVSIGNSAFYRSVVVESIIIGDGVTNIERAAFSNIGNNSDVVNLIIGSSVESIEGLAFIGCKKITKIIIPESVKNLAGGVFSGCEGLSELYLLRPSTAVDGITKANIYTSTEGNSYNIFHKNDDPIPVLPTIYVPDNDSLASYQAAANWSDYSSSMQVGSPPANP